MVIDETNSEVNFQEPVHPSADGVTDYHIYPNIVEQCTITYSIIGSVFTTQSYSGAYSGNFPEPEIQNPRKAFSHWSLEPNGEPVRRNDLVNRSVTLYGVLIDRYFINFHSRGGSAVENVGAEENKTVDQTLIGTPTKPGYTFAGWKIAADGSGPDYNFSIPLTEDVDVYAAWEPEETSYYASIWLQNAEDVNVYEYSEAVELRGLSGTETTIPEDLEERYPGV